MVSGEVAPKISLAEQIEQERFRKLHQIYWHLTQQVNGADVHNLPFNFDFSVYAFRETGTPIVKLIGPMENYSFSVKYQPVETEIIFTKPDCSELTFVLDTTKKLELKQTPIGIPYIYIPSRDYQEVWISSLDSKLFC